MIDSVSSRLVNKLGSGFSASSKIGLVLKNFAPEFAKTTCLLIVFLSLIGLQCANGFIYEGGSDSCETSEFFWPSTKDSVSSLLVNKLVSGLSTSGKMS
jgi:hypothetical protein